MLRASLAYPSAGEDWVRTVLVGGVLTAVGAFLLPPLVAGPGVLRPGAALECEPRVGTPRVRRVGELFVDGVVLLLVQLVYVLVPAVVVFVGLAVGGYGAFSGIGGTSTGAAVELVGWGIMFLGAFLALVAVYLVPAAVANVAYEEAVGAAFAIGTVTDAAFTADYLVALLRALLVGTVLGGVAAVLSLLFVGVFLAFYVQVSVYYLLGRGYAEGRGLGH